MAERVQKPKPKSRKKEDVPEDTKVVLSGASIITESLDEILDEIDTILEENEAEFINSYIRRSGE